MKKLISISLILLAMTHIGGLMPFYLMFVQEVKQEMMLELGVGQNLETINVDRSDYNNVSVFRFTGKHEFVYNGSKYDFSSSRKTESGFQFIAIKDLKESLLDELLALQFEDTNSKHHKSPFKKLIKNFAKEFLSNTNNTTRTVLNTDVLALVKTNELTLEGHQEVQFPPPDCAA